MSEFSTPVPYSQSCVGQAAGTFGEVSMRALWKHFMFCPGFLLLMAGSVAAQTGDTAKTVCKDAKTQREMNECLASAYRDADEELNVFYSTLRKKFDSEALVKLQDAQRAWIKYRDTNCEAESALYEGGSIQPAVRAACLERATRARIAELHLIYDTGTR
jgi:uncharacterized protein YecT (DUF1311 family)